MNLTFCFENLYAIDQYVNAPLFTSKIHIRWDASVTG
jgi:hypothetical protein